MSFKFGPYPVWWYGQDGIHSQRCSHPPGGSHNVLSNLSTAPTAEWCVHDVQPCGSACVSSPQLHSVPQRAGLPGVLQHKLRPRRWLRSVHPLVRPLHSAVVRLLVPACLQGLQVRCVWSCLLRMKSSLEFRIMCSRRVVQAAGARSSFRLTLLCLLMLLFVSYFTWQNFTEIRFGQNHNDISNNNQAHFYRFGLK